MPVLGRGQYERQLARDYAPIEAKKRARREAEAEAARLAQERLEIEVEAEMVEERKAAEAEAAMTPEERTERRLRGLELPLSAQLARRPGRPRGWACAREAVAARWRREAEQEREQRERKLGITDRQAKWDKRRQEIEDARAGRIREAVELCREGEQAARGRAETELAELGDRPSLSEHEVMA